ncbi:putative exosome complex component (CSL4) [Vairimorpha necatrix]|uniref:Exosome complex component (CSL4) n=1 Tax=Vairimorpha necatrix TaxID=6039 RepID=A0AAX4JFE9_9MICR
MICPALGLKCKGKIVKVCFSNILININQIEGNKSLVPYKGILKYDKNMKTGEEVECIIVSYSDNGINCIPL